MDRIGISFKSPLTPEEVRLQYVQPLRTTVEDAHAGIYTNYLRQADQDDDSREEEHLLVFLVRDFQTGLRLLRVKLQELTPQNFMFHNLDASEPMY